MFIDIVTVTHIKVREAFSTELASNLTLKKEPAGLMSSKSHEYLRLAVGVEAIVVPNMS